MSAPAGTAPQLNYTPAPALRHKETGKIASSDTPLQGTTHTTDLLPLPALESYNVYRN